MDDYRMELQQINACCDKLGISRALLNATDVARLTGYSRSQLARQIADLAMYQPE